MYVLYKVRISFVHEPHTTTRNTVPEHHSHANPVAFYPSTSTSRMDNITDTLTISSITAARTTDSEGFDCIITVCQDDIEASIDSDTTTYQQYPLADGKRDESRGGECTFTLFEKAADALHESLQRNQETLIHCHAGVSRSVSVSAAVIATQENQSVSESIKEIQAERPRAGPINRLRDYGRLYAYIHSEKQTIDTVPDKHRPPEFTGL